jgi:predicted metal-dependent hydrolase
MTIKNKNLIIKYTELDEKSQNVVFKITKTKNIRITVKSSLEIVVTFPKYCSFLRAQKFFESKIDWAQDSLLKLHKKQENIRKILELEAPAVPKLTAEELSKKNNYLISRCLELAKIHNFTIKKITLRQQKTIWGSCSYKNNISLNSNLVFLNNHLIDYVILHELTHIKIKNHSKKFWALLEKILPNYKILNRQLRSFSPSFKVT